MMGDRIPFTRIEAPFAEAQERIVLGGTETDSYDDRAAEVTTE